MVYERNRGNRILQMRVDEEELLGEVRNQKISFIHVKFEMNIRYQTTDVDSFVVHESLEFRGIVSSEI